MHLSPQEPQEPLSRPAAVAPPLTAAAAPRRRRRAPLPAAVPLAPCLRARCRHAPPLPTNQFINLCRSYVNSLIPPRAQQHHARTRNDRTPATASRTQPTSRKELLRATASCLPPHAPRPAGSAATAALAAAAPDSTTHRRMRHGQRKQSIVVSAQQRTSPPAAAESSGRRRSGLSGACCFARENLRERSHVRV